MYIGQTYVWAEVVDLDQNLIRTEVRSFNIGTNSQTQPTVEIQSVRKTGQGNFAVRANFYEFMYSEDYDYRYSLSSNFGYNERYANLIGDFSLETTINGVSVASIDLTKLPKYIDIQQNGNRYDYNTVGNSFMDTIYESNPTYAYSYEFQSIPMAESGSLDVQVVLMSRQGNENYRKVAYSDVVTVQVSEDELLNTEIPNLPPEGVLLSPRNTDLARARAVLTDTDVQTSSDFGQIQRISMTSIGRNYDPENLPEVIIQGGGGKDAEAKVKIVNGAIADLLVLDWGDNYLDGDSAEDRQWIKPIDPGNPGTGFEAYVRVSNGVLSEFQTFEVDQSGAIANPGAGYQDLVGKKDMSESSIITKETVPLVTFHLLMMLVV